MIDDDLTISVRQFDDVMHRLFPILGIQVPEDVYHIAKDMAVCASVGKEYHMEEHPPIVIDNSPKKEDNVVNDKEE